MIARMEPATTGTAVTTPATAAPQRRPESVASTTSSGASATFSASTVMRIVPAHAG
jgi:hypothetical protein